MAKIRIENDKRAEILKRLTSNIAVALEACGIEAENFAVESATELQIVDTGALRNSIGHQIEPDKKRMIVGAGVDYAVYCEYGTGIYTDGGRRTPWAYQDINGEWHQTNGVRPRPFIKPAIANHLDLYKQIFKDYLGA